MIPEGITHVLTPALVNSEWDDDVYALINVEALDHILARYRKHISAMEEDDLPFFSLDAFNCNATYSEDLPGFSDEFARKILFVGQERDEPERPEKGDTIIHDATEFEEYTDAQDLRTECDCIEIRKDSVQFKAFVKHCDLRIGTNNIYDAGKYKTLAEIYGQTEKEEA